jgi:molecular chaperone GrpE
MNSRRIPVSDEDALNAGAGPAPEADRDEPAPGDPSTVREETGAASGRAAAADPLATADGSGAPSGEAALRDQFLRLAAEFDNFRKREARERTEAWARAKADLCEKLLPALDDLRRVAHPEAADAAPDSPVRALLEGVELVERKLWQILEREGLQVVPAEGLFEPAVHEAILTQATGDPRLDGRIAHVVEPGYRFGDRLLRPARVVVWKLSR